MIRGGIADKLGNRYEAKWVVRCFLDVIADKADWLNLESIDTKYQGFEFAIAHGKVTEWHQTKINAPSGNWTIRALEKAGVLRAFAGRLSADNYAQCYFVSQDNAKDFRTLTEKARLTASLEQYLEKLSFEQKNHFKQVMSVWQQSDKSSFEMLRRSFVHVIPGKELDSFISSYGDLYFQEGGNMPFQFCGTFWKRTSTGS